METFRVLDVITVMLSYTGSEMELALAVHDMLSIVLFIIDYPDDFPSLYSSGLFLMVASNSRLV